MFQLPDWIKVKKCKKVITYDVSHKENGFLIDILNRNDDVFSGRQEEHFQQIYYSAVYQNMFKGFHIHPYKYDTVTCMYGKALLVFYPHVVEQLNLPKEIDFEELIIVQLDTGVSLQTVSFPSKYPHGYFGVSEIAYVLNYRNPAWHIGDNYQYDLKIADISDYLSCWVKRNG